MDCLFCAIAKKQIPSHIIYEDAHVLAFLDIHPLAPGHTIVIPKIHSETIVDLPDKEMAPFLKGVKKTTALLASALNPDGFTMGINQGKAAGQDVDHLHFHIIPRWHNDKGGSLQSIVNNPPKETLEEVAGRIKSAK